MTTEPEKKKKRDYTPIRIGLMSVITMWADLEEVLCELLCTLLRTDEHMIAGAVFYTLTSNKTRRDVIHNVGRVVLRKDHPDEFGELEKLMRRLQRASSKRNNLLHATWRFSDPEGDIALFRFNDPPGFFEMDNLTVDDLLRSWDQMKTLKADVEAYHVRVAKLLHESRGKDRQ